MNYIVVKFTPTAAIPLNGTFTLGYPEGANLGTFAGAINHRAFVEGLGAVVSTLSSLTSNSSGVAVITDPGISLAFGAANITVTWLGATAIPAGTSILFQLEVIGLDRPNPYDFVPTDSTATEITQVRFGAPLAASIPGVLGVATPVTVTTLVILAPQFSMDVPRNVTAASSAAGDNTQMITVRGFDRYGVAMTESVNLNGTSLVIGKKAFFKIASYQSTAALAGNLSLGWGNVLGLPFFLNRKRFAFQENINDATVTTGTFVIGDTTKPTATTGDVRGTFLPATLPDAVRIYELLVAAPDRLIKMVQFAG